MVANGEERVGESLDALKALLPRLPELAGVALAEGVSN